MHFLIFSTCSRFSILAFRSTKKKANDTKMGKSQLTVCSSAFSVGDSSYLLLCDVQTTLDK